MVIPGNIKKVGSAAFQACSSLKWLTFEEGLEEIGSSPFHDCNHLENISLPSTTKTVSNDFLEQGLGALKAIYLHATTPPAVTGNPAYVQGDGEKCVLYVPAGYYTVYKDNSAWWNVITYAWGTRTNFKSVEEMDVNAINDARSDNTANAPAYRLSGMAVKNPGNAKGLYIRNGKKIIIPE